MGIKFMQSYQDFQSFLNAILYTSANLYEKTYMFDVISLCYFYKNVE
jgi:hypothetical protein